MALLTLGAAILLIFGGLILADKLDDWKYKRRRHRVVAESDRSDHVRTTDIIANLKSFKRRYLCPLLRYPDEQHSSMSDHSHSDTSGS